MKRGKLYYLGESCFFYRGNQCLGRVELVGYILAGEVVMYVRELNIVEGGNFHEILCGDGVVMVCLDSSNFLEVKGEG